MFFALLLCYLVLQVLFAVMVASQDRLRAGPTSWGFCDLLGKLLGYCATGGGSRGGGGLRTPRYHGPLG